MHNVNKSLIVQEDVSFGEELEEQQRGGTNYPSLNKFRLIYPVNSLAELSTLDEKKFKKAILFEGDNYTVYSYYNGAWNISSNEANIYEYNTVANLADAYPALGAKLTTKGCLTVGDGGHSSYIVESASGIPDGYGRVLLGNGYHAVLLPTAGKYIVKQFGAAGNGSDDTVAARTAHTFANSKGYAVSYNGLTRIYLQANAQIPIKTSTDFANCELFILGGINTPPTFSSFNTLFVVIDDDCPLVSVTGAIASADLLRSSYFPTRGLFNGHGYAKLTCAYQVPSRDKLSTRDYVQSFKVNRQGRVSQPLSTDLTAYDTAITIEYRLTSKKHLKLNNISLTEGAWNNQIIFNIKRCNVSVNDFAFLFTGAGGTYDNICKIISIEDSSNIVINDFVTTGRPVTTSSGSYCLEIAGGSDIYVNRMNALTGWGATGCNNINGMHYFQCVLNRVDVHSSAHNVFVKQCDLHESGLVYGWGGGIISLKAVTLNRCSGISTRSDYGGTFFGDLIASDIEVINNFTATYKLIDLESDPMGAVIPVFAPQTIKVSNVTRSGRASTNNAELIPVAIAIRSASDIVYAPATVAVSDLKCHPSWRFGLRLDFMNMEAHPTTTVTRIVVDGVPAASVATSTSGILDFPAIRTPTAPVRPLYKISNCENLHLASRTLANLVIMVSNSDVNGIAVDTVSATQPFVSLKDCRLINMATGYTNAPIGGGTSGTGGHTILSNCEAANTPFDLSLIASSIGLNVRTGGTPPLIPGGATMATLFSGYRKPGIFL